ncbi:MAG: sigma 54-interacting transcriptional regulator [Minicystis sp.]
MDRLATIVRALNAVTTFERASDQVLAAALDIARAALAGSAYADKGRILRAMVHLRPDDGYLRLLTLEAGERETSSRVGEAGHLPSATVWRWISTQRAPVALDVDLEMVLVLEDGTFSPPKAGTVNGDLKASRLKLSGREVTHLLSVPLRMPGQRIEGMIAIEAACPAARATPFVWGTCAEELEKLAAIAAPYLTGLPITQAAATPTDAYLPVIGASMRPIIEMLRIFAAQDETILLGGPTGAGKSRLAVWCHEQSGRKGQPFETVDLATVPEDLQMAELFGWRRGAFTGAERNTPGAIARAERGTLFIDEIDKLSLRAQAGLLRVLEDRLYRPLGEGEGDKKANVRFIIGTNANLLALTQKGSFREDLYYRINVLPVRVPCLAERSDEIVQWARYMLKRRHEQSAAPGEATLVEEAAGKLLTRDWPGNLRQLDNIVRRAYALALVDANGSAGGLTIRATDVDRALAQEAKPSSGSVLEQLERAAESFVIEAERRADQGDRLDLDLTEALKGLVLEHAKRRIGGDEREALKRAFILLGKESVVKDRNHTTAHRREYEKVEKLRATLAPGEGRK